MGVYLTLSSERTQDETNKTSPARRAHLRKGYNDEQAEDFMQILTGHFNNA